MATATKICKVCGREYEYCHTARRIAGVFRWQDVACCPEHGSEYLARIVASRSGKSENFAKSSSVSKEDLFDYSVFDEWKDDDNFEDEDEWDTDEFDEEE